LGLRKTSPTPGDLPPRRNTSRPLSSAASFGELVAHDDAMIAYLEKTYPL